MQKAVIVSEAGYSFGPCAVTETKREAFQRLGAMLPINDCLNATDADAFLGNFEGTDIYRVCGLRLFFKGDCIMGVGT